MNKKIVLLIGIIAAVLAGSLVFFVMTKKGPSESVTKSKDAYYCPMHKDYVSDKPGNCPICSMKLVKKEGSDAEAMKTMLEESNPSSVPAETMSESGVYIAPEKRQMLGVRSVPAVMKSVGKEIRTVGKIAYDETRITHVHTRFNGWIEQVFVDFVGEPIKKGQPLFTIYSPELVSTQEEYLLALRSKQNLGKSEFDWISKGSHSLAESARERLKLWGISESEIKQVEQTGKMRRTLTVFSPVNGVVTQRAAYHHGTYVTPEMEIYTIVDLSSVWLLAEIYEKDLSFVKTGQNITIEFPYGTDRKIIESKIDFFYPYLDPQTRTGQVRIQLKNPANQFKPDQFVNVFLKGDEQTLLVVPSDSVLNTGVEQYVFVDLGNGYFEPRRVRISLQTSEGTGIQEGLKEGEQVVTGANFLLDSEARLKGALENMGKPSESRPNDASTPTAGLLIRILEPKTAKSGDNKFRVSVQDSNGNPITDAEVELSLLMPQMGAMPAMSSRGILLPQSDGIYEGVVNVPMAWTWETTITVRKESRVVGSLKSTVTAR